MLFEHFDELILLESGGRTVYHGEIGHDSRTLLDYLESNGAEKCPKKTNPAEYMLEGKFSLTRPPNTHLPRILAIGSGNPNYDGPDWGDTWDKSEERKARTKEIEDMIQERRSSGDKAKSEDDREYAMPFFTQLTTVLKRRFVTYWRTPSYIVGIMMRKHSLTENPVSSN